MGKRIITQARGRGSLTYRVRRRGYLHEIKYPTEQKGEATVLALIHSAGHSAPLMKLKIGKSIFFNPAFVGAIVDQTVTIGGTEVMPGNVLMVKDIPTGTRIYNIERNPGDGGKMMHVAGSSALVIKKDSNYVIVAMPNKKEVKLSGECRATIGVVAGDGRLAKPFVKAGRKFYKMKARNKLWPRVSAVKMNAIDHPFGSGRGKRIKSKIAKRNAPAGRRVGHLRPRRTGRRN